MTKIFDIINGYILAPVMRVIMLIVGNNFALAILVFTVLINLLMVPLSIKSQKTSVQQIKIKPKLDELKRKYGDDRQKFAMAQQKLYQEEKVSMSGGCLPMIVRLLFLMSVFYLVTRPISYLTTLDAGLIADVTSGYKNKGSYAELTAIKDLLANGNLTKNQQIFVDAAKSINFDLFGIDLTQQAEFSWNFAAATKLWIIPILAGVTALFSGILSTKLQKAMNPDAPNMMAMNLIMPIFSMVIAFNAPGGLGFYWACSSIVSSLVQAGVQYFYSPYKMIANERAKNLLKVDEQEKKLINNSNM